MGKMNMHLNANLFARLKQVKHLIGGNEKTSVRMGSWVLIAIILVAFMVNHSFPGRTHGIENGFPFYAGEKLTFQVNWAFILAGELTLEVLPMEAMNGAESYHFVMTARTYPYGRSFIQGLWQNRGLHRRRNDVLHTVQKKSLDAISNERYVKNDKKTKNLLFLLFDVLVFGWTAHDTSKPHITLWLGAQTVTNKPFMAFQNSVTFVTFNVTLSEREGETYF
jgi:hypothetical protein